jgi:predicted outer membrane repeat protein
MKIGLSNFLASCLLLFISFPVFAREIRVCSSGCAYSSIQAAVNAAAGGDTILLDVNGSFTENHIIISRNLVIRGLGENRTILQGHAVRGKALHRVFQITGGAVVVLENMTIQNGRESADFTSWKGAGSGILIDGVSTTVTLNRVVIRHCDNVVPGSSGGALALMGSATSLNLNNCFFDNNISNNGGGGAVYLRAMYGDCFIRQTNFKNNIAANGNGGAALTEGDVAVTFIGCQFAGNQALNGNNGGAVYASSTSPTFNNCSFSNNKAEREGGALKISGADIANCSFYYNSASNGGAISSGTTLTNQDLYIANCTLLNNAATAMGGGAGLHNASPTALIHMINTVIDKSTTGTDLYMYAASSLTTNQKNHVGRAKFTTGSAKFETN